ncbi:amidohydrolase family protein [Brevundimonas sp. Root1279]|uniref:amidohydrolase family protein n=1 Tax=Brevundimonas sp. Root1279 TaxID=1736443 RepID=UPI0006F790BE|nr:amidohydrolase family protein [Brevundimonas sp. Root1279]KQW80917.1 hypothetical protein ASC65_13195 [Brevundimonas sp. Root1279]
MRAWIPAILGFVLAFPAQAQSPGKPVIDMHLHAFKLDFAAGVPACPGDGEPTFPAIDPRADVNPSMFLTPCSDPILSPDTDEALMRDSLAELRRFNIRRAVTSGALAEVTAWRAADPQRVIPAIQFASEHPLSPDTYRRLFQQDAFQVFAEIGTQYRGVDASDPRYEPFFALAEELDIPIGIHLGEGPPGAARFPGYETYRARLTTPFQLEAVLQKHPKLRIYVMHYASPLVDEMIAMMFSYPNLHVDISCNNWAFPRAQFHDQLKRMIDAGFEKRILWGSDQMIWPGAIAEGIEAVETAPFLSEAQKRDIFYNNAARFLRLTDEQIAADHAD